MSTRIELFDYTLPPEFIAQHSVEPRDAAKFLMLERASGAMKHQHIFDLPQLLRAGDVLVFNNTKVFRSRLRGWGLEGGRWNAHGEIFLVREVQTGHWEALMKPTKNLAAGDRLQAAGTIFRVLQKQADGTVILETELSREQVLALCEEQGEVPIPPYVEKSAQAVENYQTVYAKELGAVAAPTAGFHFTETLLDKLKAMGVQVEFVTLHVGIGTFRPVQTATLEEHTMHSEWASLDAGTAERINAAKREGRRVIAVGTTVVRVLEGTEGKPYTGELNLFIKPGFAFKVVDGLITNFHLPKSTLLALVSAFAGRENILSAYEEAKRMSYRFYSFGDAMFIY